MVVGVSGEAEPENMQCQVPGTSLSTTGGFNPLSGVSLGDVRVSQQVLLISQPTTGQLSLDFPAAVHLLPQAPASLCFSA